MSFEMGDKQGNNVVSLSGRRHKRKDSIQARGYAAKKILVVGADNTTYRIIEEFSRKKALVHSATTSDNALDQIEATDYDLIIMVNYPPKVDALNVIRLFRFINTRSKSKFLVLHDDPDWDVMVHIHEVKVDASLSTPYKPIDLKKKIDTLLA